MNINKVLKIKQFNAKDLDEVEGEVLIYGELVNTLKSCPVCQTEPAKPHQYHKKKIRTVPFNATPTYLLFTHTAYLCEACGKRYLEKADFFDKYKRHTSAYEEYLYTLSKKQDINRVAELENLSWNTVNDVFLKAGKTKGSRK